MNRRDVLKGLAGTGGIVFLGSCSPSGLSLVRRVENLEYQRQLAEQRVRNIYRIYNELPKHVYVAETITDIRGAKEINFQKGVGIVIDGKYLTMTHIINSFYNEEKKRLNESIPPGHQIILPDMLSQEIYLYEKKLEKVVVDDGVDVAIFKLPNDLKLPDFPAKPSLNVNLGDEIFILGNPQLSGMNIRSGYVSDLDGTNKKNRDSLFGIDIPVVPGDSGCPIVSVDFKLLGLGLGTISFGFGYVKRIGEFLKYL